MESRNVGIARALGWERTQDGVEFRAGRSKAAWSRRRPAPGRSGSGDNGRKPDTDALAIGALAIGRLAIGRLAVGRSRVRSLEIDELAVKRLRVAELHVTDSLVTPAADQPHLPPTTKL